MRSTSGIHQQMGNLGAVYCFGRPLLALLLLIDQCSVIDTRHCIHPSAVPRLAFARMRFALRRV